MARISSGLIEFTPAALANELVHTTSPGKHAQVKKIMGINRTGGNGFLRFGYMTVAAVWVQVSPDLLMIAGIDFEWDESQIPIFGNGPLGFIADTTAITGTAGAIYCRSTVAGAAGVNVHIVIEVEETP